MSEEVDLTLDSSQETPSSPILKSGHDYSLLDKVEDPLEPAHPNGNHPKKHEPTEIKYYSPCNLGAGIMGDIRERILPYYKSDFVDGWHPQIVSSLSFIFFACLATCVTFGGVIDDETDNWMGAMEMLLSTSLGGMVWSLTCGQPLIIMGGTGPMLVFTGIIKDAAKNYGYDFLTWYSWIGYWTAIFVIIASVTNLSYLLKYFSRFTEETFAALISIIFIYEAIDKLVKLCNENPIEGANAKPNIALWSSILVFATCGVALFLRGLTTSHYLNGFLRRGISKFAVPISLLFFVTIDYVLDEIDTPKLPIPTNFAPTRSRNWVINPLKAVETGEDFGARPIFAAIIPALLATILVYMDQQITAVIINKPDNKGVKGGGYHLDLLVTGVLIGINSIFGFPWLVAATVRSIAHTQSLTFYDYTKNPPRSEGVLEQRVSGFCVHLLIGLAAIFIRPLLAEIPTPVLYGLFLYMGVASIDGNQFFDRAKVFFMFEQENHPSVNHVKGISLKKMHFYTFIQVVCVGILWLVKISPIGLFFPLVIAALVGVRWMIERYSLFTARELEVLDSHE